MQAALLLGPFDPADSVMLEVSAADTDPDWSLWQALIGKSQLVP